MCQLRLFWSRTAALWGEKKTKSEIQKDIPISQRATFKQLLRLKMNRGIRYRVFFSMASLKLVGLPQAPVKAIIALGIVFSQRVFCCPGGTKKAHYGKTRTGRF